MKTRIIVALTLWLALAGAVRAQDQPTFWFNGDYLLWWVSKAPLPAPLVTSGAAGDFVPGALGQPGTKVLYGGSQQDMGTFSGLRLGLGAWLDDSQLWGVEASGFFLAESFKNFRAKSDAAGNPVFAQPVVIPG